MMARGKKGTRGETEFTKKVGDKVIDAIRVGMTMEDAAEFASISKSTLFRWLGLAASRDSGRLLKNFSDRVSQAKQSEKFRSLQKIHRAKDWRAAAWWLGVRDPKTYGPKVRVTLDSEYEAALERLKKALPPEMYDLALDAIIRGEGEGEEGGAAAGEADPARD